MGVRGQSHEAWLSRWRDGACPVHGVGFIDDPEAGPAADGGFVAERCPREECSVRVARWPGPDRHHASYGWRDGPEEIRALLAKAGDVEAEGQKPGRRGRVVRISWPLEDEGSGR